MSAAKSLLDHKLLKTLSPLCDLSPDMLAELSAKSRVEQVVSGATIFRTGERDHRTLYLISGKLDLTDASGRSTRLLANSKAARQPLDPEKPHTITAVAKTSVALLNVDTGLLEMLLNWGRGQSYDVSSITQEEEEETDWMSRFLQSKVFLKLHAENIQAMMMRMEDIPVQAGEEIIRQGDTDDNYYIIAKGRAKVARKVTAGAPLMKLAILSAGTGFGEEALISDGKRNASVTMIEGGRLMRLSKKDFIELLVTPVLQYVTHENARSMGEDCDWLDVRKLGEYSQGSLPEARNVPLAELRLGLRKLNKLRKFIVFSDDDNLSAAAAFLLNQHGLDAYVLSNGLEHLQKQGRATAKAKPAPTVPPVLEKAVEPQVPEVKSTQVAAPAPPGVDGRVENLMLKAKQRVKQEMDRAVAAEEARKQAQEEVARLRAETEAARLRAEQEMREAAKNARSEAEHVAAEQRAQEMAREQAEREAVVQRVEAESARAKLAEIAQHEAEERIEHIKQESAQARREMEEQTRRNADRIRKDSEEEIIRLKTEAEMVRQRAKQQAQVAADQARSEADRELARQRAEAGNQHQQEVEVALHKAEIEARRAQQAEAARQQAEDEAERMRVKAEDTQREMEEQARLAADQARSEAEREAARQRAEDLAVQQENLEEALGKVEVESARAQDAEKEVNRLKAMAEEARKQAEEQARMAADAARSEVEREMAALRAEEMVRQQAEREEMAVRAEDEAHRARAAEAARQQAEAEIQRLKVDAEVARMQLEEQAQRVADAARSDAEREALRAQAAEEARLLAESQLERVELEAEQMRLESEAQARLAADHARSEAEREAAALRAVELTEQHRQLEEIARRAEEEAARARLADEARQRAEQEIARQQKETAAAAKRAEVEADRAKAAEAARIRMETEMADLRAEAKAARAQVEKQARLFAAAQHLETEETGAGSASTEQPADAEGQRAKEEEAEYRIREADDFVRRTTEEAERARQEAENMQRKSEEQIRRLKVEAEAARMNAELEVKRSIVVSQREVDQKLAKQRALAKGRKAAMLQQRKKMVAQKSQRAREAREAALSTFGREFSDLEAFLTPDDEPDALAQSEHIVVNQAEIAARAKERENLIDPTEEVIVEVPTRKRQWVSDDFIWEATLGYQGDPDPEGSPTNSVGLPDMDEPERARHEPPAQRQVHPAESVEKNSRVPKFQTSEIDRRIRPQSATPTGRPRRRHKGLWLVMPVLVVGVTAAVWYFTADELAPVQLKQVVNRGATSLDQLKTKVEESLKNTDPEPSSGTPTAKVLSDNEKEAMARLRERLDRMKAETRQAVEEAVKVEAEAPEARVVAVPAAVEGIVETPKAIESVTIDEIVEAADQVLTAQQRTVVAPVADSIDSLPVLNGTKDKKVLENRAPQTEVQTDTSTFTGLGISGGAPPSELGGGETSDDELF
ncbi:MAG: cyclic nucleotide-binding domain-containing protein [Gammaproteobacteria bacterium]|nr:cyclic nucleotide-binding domain-containing protein [Gammaproteobacteria bacterium]